MKKFLSLVLALVMTMSLVTVSAGAKDFGDSDELSGEQYEEAVNVMSEMGIIDGYADGDFRPQGTLTRQAAAKIIACMMLGKTTAESLGTSAAPFKDVPAGNSFAGYIAFCVERGLISGYGDGTFRPTGTLTGFAFLKMLLGALGYDQSIEGYTGTNWTVNVASRAIETGLTNGDEGFVGSRALTREEACLFAVNTLKATLVEYENKGTNITVNGAVVVQNASKPTYVTSNIHDAATSINDSTDNVKNGWTVEFAEKYQPDLAMKDTTDAFGRPAHTWTWKKAEIGTYVDFDKMVAEYTTKVTGEDLYDLLGKTAIEDNTLYVYVDGEDTNLGSAAFDKTDLVKRNDEAIGETGNGVLTQVFLDTQEDEITVAIINTYLAKAAEDYDEKNDDVDLTVYYVDNTSSSRNPVYTKTAKEVETINVDGEDFDIADVAEDDLFLVTIAEGTIQTMEAPEVLSETAVDSFRREKYVTTDGTQYDYADTVMYDEDVLDKYDNQNMKDVTYNIILDPYGYLIGIELNEDPDQYVFLTGLDGKYSNLSVKEADANIIFLSGDMQTVTVNMTKSTFSTATLNKNLSQLNTWCTYTVNDAGVYTLKEVAVSTTANVIDKTKDIDVAQYAQDVGVAALRDAGVSTKTISQKYVSLVSSYDSAKPATTYVYGNDDTVYINVELEDVIVDDSSNGGANRWIIDDVESVTTGVKNANLVMENLTNVNGYRAPAAEIYTLYNDDGYVIAAVTIGENEGSSSNYVYVTSKSVNREALTGSEWTWSREVYAEGEIKTLTEVGSSLDVLDTMTQGQWYEVKYDANGNVRKAEALLPDLVNTAKNDGFIDDVADVETAVNAKDTVLLADINNVVKLTFKNGTLYTDVNAIEGFSVSPDAKILLCLASKSGAQYDDTEVYSGYTGLEKALRDMNAVAPYGTVAADGTSYVEASAILENGVATSIVINDKVPAGSATTPGIPGSTTSMGVTVNTTTLSIVANFVKGTSVPAKRVAIANALNNAGVQVSFIDSGLAYVLDTSGRMYAVTINEYFSITLDGTVVDYVLDTASIDYANKDIDLSSYTNGTGYLKDNVYSDYNKVMTAGTTAVAANTVIETGYVKTVTSTSGSTWGTTSVTGVGSTNFSNGSRTYFALKDGQTISFTTTANPSATTGGTVELVVTGGNGKTVTAAQHLTLAEVQAGKALSFKISGDITSEITKISIKVTDDVVTYDVADPAITYTDAATGLTVTAEVNKLSAANSDVVTVTLTVSGIAAKASKITVGGTGATGSLAYQATGLPSTMRDAGSGVLNIDNGANYNIPVTVQYSFVMGAADAAPTVDVNAQ